jgi:phasin protein
MMHDPVLQTYRPAVQMFADVLHLSLCNAARFHAQQLKLVEGALSDTAAAMKEIDAARDLRDVIEIQAKLSRRCVEAAVDGWKDLWQEAGQDQVDAIQHAQARFADLGNRFRESAISAPAEAAPALAAFRSVLDAACRTYALSGKAVEELGRAAAAQAGSPAGSAAGQA